MREKIAIRCECCGSAKIIARIGDDPPDSIELIIGECSLCAETATKATEGKWLCIVTILGKRVEYYVYPPERI